MSEGPVEENLSPVYHSGNTPDTPELTRQNAMMNVVAGKGPMEYDMEEHSEEELPDLAMYFDQFELTLEAQVKICRAYASYLTSMMPSKQRKKKKLCD